jgi:putative ABC transport system permease protein
MTGLSMALGVALVVAVLVVLGVVKDSFTQNAEGYNVIVGPKGGQLELVLNTVFHLGTPKSTLPWSYYEDFTTGKYAPSVELAIPYCLGDNYEGYRVVATTSDLFNKAEYRAGKKYAFTDGRNFEDDEFFEAVVGATVARKTGIKVGSEFQPAHGVTEDELAHKHDAFQVVGVLEPTGTPNDRALFINLEGFFLLEGHALDEPVADEPTSLHAGDEDAHDHDDAQSDEEGDAEHAYNDAHDDDAHHDTEHGHEHADGDESEPVDEDDEHVGDEHERAGHEGGDTHQHDDAADVDHAHDDHAHDHSHAHHHEPLPRELREVTSILLRTNLTGGLTIPAALQRDPRAMAVMPVREVTVLFEGLVGNLQLLLLGLAILVVVVAGIGIMVSIYNTMNDRRRDIAVMRALGAGKQTVMIVILFESLLLSLGGGLAGLVLGHGLIALLNPLIIDQTGVSIGLLQFQQGELALVPGLIVLATVAGIVPALAAYRTDVSKALAASP